MQGLASEGIKEEETALSGEIDARTRANDDELVVRFIFVFPSSSRATEKANKTSQEI